MCNYATADAIGFDGPCSGIEIMFAWTKNGDSIVVCEKHRGVFLYWYRGAREVDATGAEIVGGIRGMYADYADAR